jgi:hypothetical protein
MRDGRIEALYVAFSHRPRPRAIEGCPCCVGRAREEALLSRPLRAVGADILGFYAFKAMTTFGSEEDFLYFLPRILELEARGEPLGATSLELLMRKVHRVLPACTDDERIALRGWAEALWDAVIDGERFVAELRDAFAACKSLGLAGDALLERWLASTSPRASELVLDAVIDLASRSNGGRAVPADEIDQAILRDRRVRWALERASARDAELAEQAASYLAWPPFRD